MDHRPRRRPTVKDVAAAAGVAPMTVSYTFNHPNRVAEATRVRVLEEARRLGYRPDGTARALRSGRTHQLGLVVGEHLSYVFDDPQAAQFVAGVADVCVERDLGLVLIPTRGGDGDADRVLAAAVDGYVLWTTVADDPVLDAVAASGRPAAIQGGPDHPGLVRVGPDDRAAAEAVAASVPLAGSTPVVISFPLDRRRTSGILRGRDLPDELTDVRAVPFPVTGARLAGYRDALVSAGHDWDEVRIAVVERNERALGEEAATRLLGDLGASAARRPVVVLAMSDELALGARTVFSGSDVALTGWDGSPAAAAAGVWSVAASLRAQGRACALVALEDGSQTPPVQWTVAGPAR